jgi:hypothetical protein
MTMFRTLAFSTMAVMASIGAAAAAQQVPANQFSAYYHPQAEMSRDHAVLRSAPKDDYFSRYNRDLNGTPCGVECD